MLYCIRDVLLKTSVEKMKRKIFFTKSLLLQTVLKNCSKRFPHKNNTIDTTLFFPPPHLFTTASLKVQRLISWWLAVQCLTCEVNSKKQRSDCSASLFRQQTALPTCPLNVNIIDKCEEEKKQDM